jgi:ATP-dependent DNA helicase PIF1
MEKLNNQQQQIFDKYVNGENIFISGPGGAGKTFLIKLIVADAINKQKQFKVCALTGCAAILLNCGATTLHSFAGIGLAKGSVNQVVESVVKNKYRKSNWSKTELLIIDEVSMLSLKLFIILDLIAKRIKQKRTTPFGGMQIIFSGDFYQLPPVGNEEDPDTFKFCFETPLWNELFPQNNQIVLQTIFRQTDEKYAKILNRLRIGEVTKKGIEELQKCVNKTVNKDDNPTILMPLRKSADIINNIEYNKLDKISEHIYELKTVDDIDIKTDKSMCNGLWSDDDKNYEQQLLTNSVMVDKIINLRIGSVVMCVVNLNTNIYNGSKGVVIDFIDNNPLVKFNNITLLITPHVWQSEKIPTIGIKQLPLIYAWAITIHKSQGMTLDTAYIDIGNFIFECGQTYVALSRVKTLEGLYLKNLDISKITVNMKVKNFYSNLDDQKKQENQS